MNPYSKGWHERRLVARWWRRGGPSRFERWALARWYRQTLVMIAAISVPLMVLNALRYDGRWHSPLVATPIVFLIFAHRAQREIETLRAWDSGAYAHTMPPTSDPL